ncbi:hypothetical protein GDO81_013580 [Engystomops pustulosus]|uniref:KIND domain-containing protein n=1 Tax=Engystomops pustulosus TaxID=76066 RepID=A0AAV7B1G4_ENGPU|nr:hypothetical protein GDO81_013580 [Engystomops pustulosus]
MDEIHGKVTLKDILKGTGQPVSEEQAWALCYQCSCKLKQIILKGGDFPALRGAEHIYIHQDGTVSFVDSIDAKDSKLSEKEVIDRLGMVVYAALDWGLDSETERVLCDSLDYLLLYMLELHTTNNSTTKMHSFTLNEIIKECVERLLVPSDASTHYRAVCRIQYDQFKELHGLLQTIQLSKRSLKRLDSNKELEDGILLMYDNWGTLWSNVMKELRLGVTLRSVHQRSYTVLPIQYTLTPYEILMDDIRSKRYTLRPVKECDQNKSSRSEENVILDLIRTHPLKPASERKLKERSQEEPSLHELLMTEIKSSKTLRSTLDVKSLIQDEELKISRNVYPVKCEHSLYSYRMGNWWNQPPAVDPLDNGIDCRFNWNLEYSYESSSEHKFSDLTSSSTDLSFLPVFTSSQVDLRVNIANHEKQTSYGHKRSNSYEGSFRDSSYGQNSCDSRLCLPPNISELITVRRTMVKTEMLVFKSFSGPKACSSCHRKMLFFSWHLTCKFCDRTICPKCDVEMLMPFKQCKHLPVSFFKALDLTMNNDSCCQAKKNWMFLREAMEWDYSSVPLVFEPKDLAEDLSFYKRVMYNWISMDICINCKDYILDVLDANHQREFRVCSINSRSISESSPVLSRQ